MTDTPPSWPSPPQPAWPGGQYPPGAWDAQRGQVGHTPQPSWWQRHKKTIFIVLGTLVGVIVVLGIIGAVVPDNSGSSSNNGPGAAALEKRLLEDLHSTGTDGFDEQLAKSVTCVMPRQWSPGSTFTCYVYGAASGGRAPELGTLRLTVLPNQGNEYRWNEVWGPTF